MVRSDGDWRLLYFEELDSTMLEMCRQLAHNPACTDGFGVMALRQSAGRGRLQRIWKTGDGCNLAVSFFIQSPLPTAITLPFVACLAVGDVLRSWGLDRGVHYKWPNDVQVNGRKICGILCQYEQRISHSSFETPSEPPLNGENGDGWDTELTIKSQFRQSLGSKSGSARSRQCSAMRQSDDSSGGGCIIGIGLNLGLTAEGAAEIDQPVTSVLLELGYALKPKAAVEDLQHALRRRVCRWRSEGLALMAAEWYEHCAHAGQMVRVDAGTKHYCGRTIGLTEQGVLLLDGEEGVREVVCGDVIL